MPNVVKNINLEILKFCREQIGISSEEVIKKVPKLLEIEAGIRQPTFKQLDDLAALYNVPRWVFIRDSLPEQFKYDKTVPGFRQVKDSPIAVDPYTSNQVKKIMARLDNLRSLIIELDEEIDQSIGPFNPPEIDQSDISDISIRVREWLGCQPTDSYSLHDWKALVEKKGVFVFLTSKYSDWSHVDPTVFRGLSIYHDKLPIIVINDSDSNKAQSFTLFHELAHLLRKESSTDGWTDDKAVERWCDNLAGSILLPSDVVNESVYEISTLKKVSQAFKVSPYAYLVRQKQLKLIDDLLYRRLEAELKREWKDIQKKLKDRDSGPPRNRPKEISEQYGRYSRIILQAYLENELSINKVLKVFNLKKADHVLEMIGES